MERYRVILVEPQDARNVGSVARVASNYDVDDLWLVSVGQITWQARRRERILRKKTDTSCGSQSFPQQDAELDTAVAEDRGSLPLENSEDCGQQQPGHGEGIVTALDTNYWGRASSLATSDGLAQLKSIQVADNLVIALRGCSRAVAFTGKEGANFRATTTTVRDIHVMTDATAASNGDRQRAPVALVFGNEARGLTNKDTLLCSAVCTLPTSGRCTSLNLSHCVAVVLSRLFELHIEKPDMQQPQQQQPTLVIPPNENPSPVDGGLSRQACRATEEDVADLAEHCRQRLEALGHPASTADWSHNGRRRNNRAYQLYKQVASLRRLLQRASATSDEVRSMSALVDALGASSRLAGGEAPMEAVASEADSRAA
mmetsp:Transcript_83828/g.166322  ORF Transcript_83828/g.166322 Transcript_83828/m.166322 type:complete len:372 (-) Transcript_83828:19-1134(-)